MTEQAATELSQAPDISALELPIDRWTEPFWAAAAREVLLLPRCTGCAAYRWPAGPFCPECNAQELAWVEAGEARLYSYTIVRQRKPSEEGPGRLVIPGLVEFAGNGGVRIPAAIVGDPSAIAIDMPLVLEWSPHGETKIPVFRLPAAA